MPTAEQLQALADMFNVGGRVPAGPTISPTMGVDRNPARAAALQKMLGISDSPTSFYSEQNLEDTAQEQSQAALAEKVAPAQVTAAGNLAVEQAKEAGERATEAAKGQSALALERVKQEPGQALLGKFFSGETPGQPAGQPNPGAPGTVMGGYTPKPSVGPSGEMSMAFEPPKGDPQQVQAQMHAAQVGLAQYPGIRDQIKAAADAGVSGPIMGPLASWATSKGWDSYLMSPEHATMARQLAANLSLLKSNLAYAHGAARGGASPAIQQRFDPLFNVNMSPAALKGSMDAAETWLRTYAGLTNNFTKTADPNDPRLAQADAALGIGGP